jgi:hypothetical protein
MRHLYLLREKEAQNFRAASVVKTKLPKVNIGRKFSQTGHPARNSGKFWSSIARFQPLDLLQPFPNGMFFNSFFKEIGSTKLSS